MAMGIEVEVEHVPRFHFHALLLGSIEEKYMKLS